MGTEMQKPTLLEQAATVREALLKKPALLYEVLRMCSDDQVLGPWTLTKQSTIVIDSISNQNPSEAWCRYETSGANRVRVWQKVDGSWATDTGKVFQTLEEAMAEEDQHFVRAGWILSDEDPDNIEPWTKGTRGNGRPIWRRHTQREIWKASVWSDPEGLEVWYAAAKGGGQKPQRFKTQAQAMRWADQTLGVDSDWDGSLMRKTSP